jgi:hypothetical protein
VTFDIYVDESNVSVGSWIGTLLNDGHYLQAHRTLSIFLGVPEPNRARDLAAFLATLIASA